MNQFVFLFSLSFFLNCITFATLKPNLQDVDLKKIEITNKESILVKTINDIEVNNKKTVSSSKVKEYEIEFFIKILKESKFFSSVEKGLIGTDKKLIITLNGKAKANFWIHFISSVTLMIIPFYIDRDLELTYSFQNKKETILEFKRGVQTTTWIQLFLLPVSLYMAITDQENKYLELMTKSALEEAYKEGVFK